jgi:hypothetical protein
MREGVTADFLADLATENLLDDVSTIPDGCVFKPGTRVGLEPIMRVPAVFRPDNLGVFDPVYGLALFEKEVPHGRPGGVYPVSLKQLDKPSYTIPGLPELNLAFLKLSPVG